MKSAHLLFRASTALVGLRFLPRLPIPALQSILSTGFYVNIFADPFQDKNLSAPNNNPAQIQTGT
jgi:hypothetical protein